ncbi:MAG: cell division protein ZapA [Lachnospiraceae bacterium]|nr:cell division protein ZapA [Lachnospiraceae bacterium]
MNEKTDVDVIINGKTYTISGYESSEYLQRVALHINDLISEFQKQDGYRRLDSDMKTILLAINLGDDYYKAQQKIEEIQEEKSELEKEIFEMKHKMMEMQTELKEISEEKELLELEKTESENKVVRLEAELEASKNEREKQENSSRDKKHGRR